MNPELTKKCLHLPSPQKEDNGKIGNIVMTNKSQIFKIWCGVWFPFC